MFIGSFIPNWILKLDELSACDKIVYARLSQYAGKDGECFPKQETIAEECGMSISTVNTSIKNLVEIGLLECVKRGQGKTNLYFFLESDLFDYRIPDNGNSVNRNVENPLSSNADFHNHSTKENQLRESEKEGCLSQDINYIQEKEQEIKKFRYNWEVFAMSINLIDKSYPEDLDIQNCLADPLFDIHKIKVCIANSKRLRGIGKGNSKANTVSLKSIVTNPNLRQQIMDGEFDDSKSETAVKFVDSKQYDWEVFKAEMLTNETYKEKYAGANIKHYYDELKSWSKRNQKKSYDWIEEALNFMRLDSEGRGLKLGNGETKTFTIREGYGQS